MLTVDTYIKNYQYVYTTFTSCSVVQNNIFSKSNETYF